MVRIEKVRQTVAVSGGNQQGVLDLQVSTAADLPDSGEVVCGIAILPGSIAQIIQTGDFVTLDYDGTWYSADGSGAAATPERSTRGLAKSAQLTGITNSLLDIEPQTAEFVEEKEPVEVKDGGERR